MSPKTRWILLALLLVDGCAPGRVSDDAGKGGDSLAAGAASAGEGLAVVSIDGAGVRALAARPGANATLVNVWATWCVPCREEFPALMKVARNRAADGLRVVLVSADFPDQLPEVRRFLAGHGVTDTSYIQTGKEMAFIQDMNPEWSGALPATFVYNRDGALELYWEGAADEDRFNRSVDQAVADRSSGRSASP